MLLKITVLLKINLWWSQHKKPKFTKKALHVITRHRNSKLFEIRLSLGIMYLQEHAETCLFFSFSFFFKSIKAPDFSKVKSQREWTAIELWARWLLGQSHWTDTDMGIGGNSWGCLTRVWAAAHATKNLAVAYAGGLVLVWLFFPIYICLSSFYLEQVFPAPDLAVSTEITTTDLVHASALVLMFILPFYSESCAGSCAYIGSCHCSFSAPAYFLAFCSHTFGINL